MQAFRVAPRRSMLLVTSIIAVFIIFFEFYGDIPDDHDRSYEPVEVTTGAMSLKQNKEPQLGYFKEQPEWDWKVPSGAKCWDGYARTPRNKDVVVLTASDGGGHNSVIPNVLQRVLEDRQKYCDRQSYTCQWLNTSRYDIRDAHRTWTKIPAVAEAFYLNPGAEWVWLVDTDIIIMAPEFDLVKNIVSPAAIEKGLLRGAPILDGQLKKNLTTATDFRVEDIDVLITQDHQSVNTGSTFFRRSAFTRYLLEMMMDYSMLMGSEHPGAEQDAIMHFMLEHPLIRKHIGIFPQRKFNAYVQGGDNMGYRDGDLLVHLAGCWVPNKCSEWFEQFWEMRGHTDRWRPVGNE